jgi:hypothetical protein
MALLSFFTVIIRKEPNPDTFPNDVWEKCCLIQLSFGPELSHMSERCYTFSISGHSWLHKSSCYVLRNCCSFPVWTEWVPREEFCCLPLTPAVIPQDCCNTRFSRQKATRGIRGEYNVTSWVDSRNTILEPSGIIARSEAGNIPWPLPASEGLLCVCVSNLSEDNGLSCF